jgi:signal peptidase I
LLPDDHGLQACCNLLLPGLGSVYNGQPQRGLILYLCRHLVTLLALLALAWIPGFFSLVFAALLRIAYAGFVAVDGFRKAREATPDYRLAHYNRWYVYALIAVTVVMIDTYVVTTGVTVFVQAFRIPTPSMEPTVMVDDYLIVNNQAYWFSKPKRGDIAVHRDTKSGKTYMHRVIGVPGDAIEIRRRTVFINDQKLDEPYVYFIRPPGQENAREDSHPPLLLPPDTYFLMGDNRDNSMDSRYTGPVQGADIVGKAKMLYFSWDSKTEKVRWNRLGKVVE